MATLWMVDTEFYVPFNRISVISGGWWCGTEKLYAMEPSLQLEKILLSLAFEPRPLS